MIRIGILGDIGSGKSHVAKNFGYPVFNADAEVGILYKKDRQIFNKLKKVLPKYIYSFPINKDEISQAILVNNINLKKIVNIVHLAIRKKMNEFLKKNINKKIVILDIPLLLENKLNKKGHRLIDAPVGRSPREAKVGTSLIMAGGTTPNIAEAKPIFETSSRSPHFFKICDC